MVAQNGQTPDALTMKAFIENTDKAHPLSQEKILPIYLTSFAEAALPVHKYAELAVYVGTSLTHLEYRNPQGNNYSYAKPYNNARNNYSNNAKFD